MSGPPREREAAPLGACLPSLNPYLVGHGEQCQGHSLQPDSEKMDLPEFMGSFLGLVQPRRPQLTPGPLGARGILLLAYTQPSLKG